jgi:hypothetical protein
MFTDRLRGVAGRASLAMALGLPLAAVADEAPTQAALVKAAHAAERRADPERAHALHEQARDLGSRTRLGRRAQGRARWLEARRAPAPHGWWPLVELMRFQATIPPTASDAEAFQVHIASMPPGIVRRESLQAVGDVWLRLERPEDADRVFRRLAREPGATVADRHLAVTGVARTLAARGRWEEAARWLEEQDVRDVHLQRDLESKARARTGTRLAMAVCLLFLVVATWAARGRWLAWSHLRAALRPSHVAAAALFLGGPLAIATAFDEAAFDTFTWLAGGTAMVLLVTASAAHVLAERRASRSSRWGLAAAASSAQLALAYLVLALHGHTLSFTP